MHFQPHCLHARSQTVRRIVAHSTGSASDCSPPTTRSPPNTKNTHTIPLIRVCVDQLEMRAHAHRRRSVGERPLTVRSFRTNRPALWFCSTAGGSRCVCVFAKAQACECRRICGWSVCELVTKVVHMFAAVAGERASARTLSRRSSRRTRRRT